jgi:hypothetical protein
VSRAEALPRLCEPHEQASRRLAAGLGGPPSGRWSGWGEAPLVWCLVGSGLLAGRRALPGATVLMEHSTPGKARRPAKRPDPTANAQECARHIALLVFRTPRLGLPPHQIDQIAHRQVHVHQVQSPIRQYRAGRAEVSDDIAGASA